MANIQQLFKKATKLHERGVLNQANSIYLKILKLSPNHPEAYRLLAVVALQKKQNRHALDFITKSLKHNPDSIPAHINLVSVYSALNQVEQAIAISNKILQKNAKLPAVHFNLGNLYRKTAKTDKAQFCFENTLLFQPNHAGALLNLGHIHKNLGNITEAAKCYEKVIKATPNNLSVYWALSNLKSYIFDQAQIKFMHDAIDDNTIKNDLKMPLYFALSQVCEYQENYTKAFELLKLGNDLKKSNCTKIEYKSLLEKIKCTFIDSQKNYSASQHNSNISPIFIVSLPRSGSTLVEQILASHSNVTGASETFAISKIIKSINQKNKVAYPDFLSSDINSIIQNITDEYTLLTQQWNSKTIYFTDKTPENFQYVGLILMAFPHAKIINVSRNPMDTCLSCYRQLFANGNEFSYSLKELAGYYWFNQKLMGFWKEKFRKNIIDVSYEKLIDQPQHNIQKLLESCTLQSEKSCFEFYKTKRQIKTASAGQVIKPIYKTANKRWIKYQNQLVELQQYLLELQITT